MEGGAYSPGTFDPFLVLIAGAFAYQLGLMHYLDNSAASALASFRSLLVPFKNGQRASSRDQSTYARLAYELTTLPARPCLLATLAGAALIVLVHALAAAKGIVPNYLAGTAGTTLSTVSVVILGVTLTAIGGVLGYHSIHQLVLVSRIYTQHARINVYQIRTLYALSLPGAFTAIGLMLMVAATIPILPARLTRGALNPLEISPMIFFSVVAGATFVLPLVGAQRLLAAEKNKRLAENGSRFDATAARFHHELDSQRLLQVDKLNKALAGLEIEQNALRKIPTWPWQPGAVRGVLAALLLPLAVWVLQVLLGRVLGV